MDLLARLSWLEHIAQANKKTVLQKLGSVLIWQFCVSRPIWQRYDAMAAQLVWMGHSLQNREP